MTILDIDIASFAFDLKSPCFFSYIRYISQDFLAKSPSWSQNS